MDEKIRICNYINGGCSGCVFYDKCTTSFETDRTKKEWVWVIDDLLFELKELKKNIINE